MHPAVHRRERRMDPAAIFVLLESCQSQNQLPPKTSLPLSMICADLPDVRVGVRCGNCTALLLFFVPPSHALTFILVSRIREK